MKIINLGQADRLPPVDWAATVDKLAAGSAPAPERGERPHHLAVHDQRKR